MTRFVPRIGLVMQLIVLLLVALVASQVLVFLLFAADRSRTFREIRNDYIDDHLKSVIEVLESVPANVRPQLVKAMRRRGLRMWLAEDAPRLPDEYFTEADARVLALRTRLETGTVEVAKIVAWERSADAPFFHWRDWTDRPRSQNPPREGRARRHRRPMLQMFGIRLSSGEWLHVAIFGPRRPPGLGFLFYLNLFVTGLGVMLIAYFFAGRISRPLTKLAQSADRLGRGESVPKLEEQGPKDIQDTIKAFNTMNDRLRKFIETQRRMMAAIGHDLRTPITALRIRTEFVEDAETRQKMMSTLADMQAMTEAVLSFARVGGEAGNEPTRSVDLAALVRSVVDDMSDLGAAVEMSGVDRLVYPGRPMALKRAVTNIIENGVKYGGTVEVTVRVAGNGGAEILVADQGPGIPEADFQRVFNPFVRLEESRNRETGGTGLGLPIALSAIESHGGEIRLGNRPEGGLVVTIILPPAQAEKS